MPSPATHQDTQTRRYRAEPATDTLAAEALRLARDIERTTDRTSSTTKAAIERAEAQAGLLVDQARAVRWALRGELKRIRDEERAAPVAAPTTATQSDTRAHAVEGLCIMAQTLRSTL